MMRFALFFVLGAAAAQAQNGFSATYDSDRQIKLEGPVTRIDWVNPHAFLFVNVANVNWAVEFGNPLDLEREGWKRTTLHVGDVVSVDGIPARGDSKQVSAKSVVLTKTGKRLFIPTVRDKRVVALSHEPAPRWPDGQVRLGPAPGKKGYWGSPSTAMLVETGAKVAMNDEGLLKNLSDADKVAPMQPWAKAVYLYRQRTLLKDDPFLRCIPPGGPRQFQTPHGFQFVEQKELGRILVLLGGGNRNWRIIYTDGRSAGQSGDAVLTYYGTSVGRWENKDTLVVDAVGFNEHFWFANGGLPHTEALHLTERFSRPDLSTLKYDVTIDDPRTYTRPWNASWTIAWVPDEDIQEFFCEENAETTFSR